MAAIVMAIGVVITWLATLMAFGNNIFCNTLSQSIVKYKIFSNKPAFQSLLFYLLCIVDDATFQMENLVEPIVQHVGTCFFATYAASAVHDDVFLFVSLHHINSHGQLFTKSIGRNFNGLIKMAHLKFVMVTHVYNQGFIVF